MIRGELTRAAVTVLDMDWDMDDVDDSWVQLASGWPLGKIVSRHQNESLMKAVLDGKRVRGRECGEETEDGRSE